MGYIETMGGASIARGLENAYDRYLNRKDYREEQRRKAEIHQAQMDIMRPQQLKAQMESLVYNEEFNKMVNKVNTMDQQFEASNFRQQIENFAGDPYGDNQQLVQKLKSTPMGQQLFGSITSIEPAMLNYSPQALEQTAKEQGIDLNEIYQEPYNWTVITENTQNGSSYRYLAPLDGIYATMGGSKARFDIFTQAGKRSYEKFMTENPNIASIYQREPKKPDINSLYDENGNLNIEDAYRKGLIDPSKSDLYKNTRDLIVQQPKIELGDKTLENQLKQRKLEMENLKLAANEAYAAKNGLDSLASIGKGGYNDDTAKTKNINDIMNNLKERFPDMSDKDRYLIALQLTSSNTFAQQKALTKLDNYGKSGANTTTEEKIANVLTEYKPKDDSYIREQEAKYIKDSGLINETNINKDPSMYINNSSKDKVTRIVEAEKNKIKLFYDLGREGISNLYDSTKQLDPRVLPVAKEVADSLGEGKNIIELISDLATDEQTKQLVDKIANNKDLANVTGLLDSLVASAYQYLPTNDDTPENIKTALKTFGLQLGDKLITGTLSDKDMSRLDDIVGNDYMQHRTILKKLRDNLQNIATGLNKKSTMVSDPFVRLVYVGRTIEGLNRSIETLNNRIQGKKIDSKTDSQGRGYTPIPRTSQQSNTPVDISNYTEDQIRQLPSGTIVVKKDEKGNIIGSGRIK